MVRILFSSAVQRVKSPAIFIDRDGVINHRRAGDYVLDWSQFTFVPGIRGALNQISGLGLPMIIISNQAAVGKGLLARNVLEDITVRLQTSLGADGTRLDAAYYCPHRIEEDCDCRKPKPGMLYKAADDLNLELTGSIFIGDSYTDVQAARSAGCKPVLFGSAHFESSPMFGRSGNPPNARTADELFEAVVKCLRSEN